MRMLLGVSSSGVKVVDAARWRRSALAVGRLAFFVELQVPAQDMLTAELEYFDSPAQPTQVGPVDGNPTRDVEQELVRQDHLKLSSAHSNFRVSGGRGAWRRGFLRLRFGRVTAFAMYALLIGVLFCGSLYPLAFHRYEQSIVAHAATLPESPKTSPVVPFAIGQPVHIEIPSVGISLSVVDGGYDATTASWMLSDDKVHYATFSEQPNSRRNQTYMYGHATNRVFLPLLHLQPGAEAYVTTSNGFVFTYRLGAAELVAPTNVSVLEYSGAPRLALQTCTGPSPGDFRKFFYFSYVSHERVSP